ncbi:hypothetical protein HanIR_Chr12g0594871 [Helianthus annuus]|nr:hypothetical protein HanIR_Chr12g0594871 [Helianthus annuus]
MVVRRIYHKYAVNLNSRSRFNVAGKFKNTGNSRLKINVPKKFAGNTKMWNLQLKRPDLRT